MRVDETNFFLAVLFQVVDARAGPSLKTTLKPKKMKTLSGSRMKSNQISKLQKELKRHSMLILSAFSINGLDLVQRALTLNGCTIYHRRGPLVYRGSMKFKKSTMLATLEYSLLNLSKRLALNLASFTALQYFFTVCVLLILGPEQRNITGGL